MKCSICQCDCLDKERRKFIKAIKTSKFDRTLAAKKLGISRATFFRRAKILRLIKVEPKFVAYYT